LRKKGLQTRASGKLVLSLSEDDARNGWLVDMMDNAGTGNILPNYK